MQARNRELKLQYKGLIPYLQSLNLNLLIPNLISRFSLSKEAQRKANKRNAECAQAARLCYAQGGRF